LQNRVEGHQFEDRAANKSSWLAKFASFNSAGNREWETGILKVQAIKISGGVPT
jgi:hypothetical protein